MPAVGTITPELIVEAAEELLAGGLPLNKVTSEAVRAALYGKTGVGGSHATIGPILRQWKQEKSAADQRVADVQVSVPQALIALRERHQREEWAFAVREADARHAEDREKITGQLEDQAAELVDALGLADSLQVRLDLESATNEQLRQQLQEKDGTHQALTADLAQQAQRASVAEARNDELHRQLEASAAAMAELRRELDQEKQLRINAENDKRVSLQAAETEASRLIQQLTDAQREKDRLSADLKHLQVKGEQVQVELREQTQAAQQAREEAAGLKGEIRGLQLRLQQPEVPKIPRAGS